MDFIFDLKRNWLQNICISLQITVLIWVSTLLTSFLVPSDRSVVATEQGGYYLIQCSTGNTDMYQMLDQLMSTMTDPSVAVSFAQLYEQLHTQEEFSFFLCVENGIPIPQSDVKKAFGTDSILPFVSKAVYNIEYSMELHAVATANGTASPDVYAMDSDDVARYHMHLKEDAYTFRSFTLDQGAMEHFNLQVAEGSLFSDQDFATKSTLDEEVSILLGSAYSDYFDVGDTIKLYYRDANVAYHATILGFLQEGSTVTTKTHGDATIQALDHAIVYPFTPYTSSNLYNMSMPYTNTYQEGWGIIPTDGTLSGLALMRVQKRVQDFFLQADVTPQLFGAISYGLIYFQNDTTAELVIILLLCTTAFFFCSYTVATFTKTKLVQARKYYAIQILCGRTPQSVIASFVLIQGVWHLLALALTLTQFAQHNTHLRVPCVLVALLFFVCNALQIVFLQYKQLGQSDFMQHIMEVQDD